MTAPRAYMRSTGSGENIVCLHSSVSSSKQFLPLFERMGDRYHLIATDLYGYGQSPQWPADKLLTLSDETALIEPLLQELKGPIHLVGHSYGAVVAMHVALQSGDRIASLSVYEPGIFNILFDNIVAVEAASEIWRVQREVRSLVRSSNLEAAACGFVNYWSGDGAWENLPAWQQETIRKRMPKVVSDFNASMLDVKTLSDYARIKIPVLYLRGSLSPACPGQCASMLIPVLSNVEAVVLNGLGHMGPLTHPDEVDHRIETFIGNNRKIQSGMSKNKKGNDVTVCDSDSSVS